jgi:hypothetical protein
MATLAPISEPIAARHEPGIDDPRLAEFIYRERRSNEGTQTYSKMSSCSDLPPEYQPRSSLPTFLVPVIEIPRSQVTVIASHPHPDLFQKYIHADSVSFPVHPAILGDSQVPHMDDLVKTPASTPLTVSPTASSRSVVIIDSDLPDHCVKLHCPYKISRFIRTLGPKIIRHCLTVSSDLESICNSKFAILPETIGCSLASQGKKNGWGFIVRELTPRPILPDSQKRRLIPCFSLYGRDSNHPDEPPLLVQMIQRSGEDPKSYVLKHIMFPIIECFLTAFREKGILMESHGQNTLLEVDEDFNITRIVHRDFDEEIDANVRREKGLSLDGFIETQLIDAPTENEPRGSAHSIIYDKSIGRLHFNYLAKTMQEFFGIAPEELQKECQAYFAQIMPDHTKYFPPEVYVYADQPLSPNTPNLYAAKATGTAPIWRPAIVPPAL